VATLISLQQWIPREGKLQAKTFSPHDGILTKDSQRPASFRLGRVC